MSGAWNDPAVEGVSSIWDAVAMLRRDADCSLLSDLAVECLNVVPDSGDDARSKPCLKDMCIASPSIHRSAMLLYRI